MDGMVYFRGLPAVSLIKGEDRRDNIKSSLEIISDEIKEGIGSRQVIIKPNFVSTSNPLASSHADQIRGIAEIARRVRPDLALKMVLAREIWKRFMSSVIL